MKILDKFPDKPRRAKKVRTPDTISPDELMKGCLAFQQRERRDAMYKTATFLVKHFWGKPTEVAEGLGVLLCVWNNAFYRLGPFDYDLLEQCIARNQAVLDAFRHRNILTHSPDDDRQIRPEARAYDCYYHSDPPGQYMAFFLKTKAIAEALAPQVKVGGKTLLKLIDEYNYAKYTQGWI